jgi:hypothetical protein
MLNRNILEKKDGSNGIKTVLVNSNGGSHAKKIILLISLNNRYMHMPKIRDKNENKP